MEKYREDIKTIFQVLIGISCFMALVMNLTGTVYLIVFGTLFLVRIFEKLLYYSRENKKELRVITHTDIYHRMSSFTIGGFIILFAIGLYLSIPDSYAYLFIGGLIGSFIFTNAIFFIPSLLLKIEQDKLHISGPNENIARAKQIIDLKEIKAIDIQEETITILKQDDSICEVIKLDLNKKWRSMTDEFLTRMIEDKKLEEQVQISSAIN